MRSIEETIEKAPLTKAIGRMLGARKPSSQEIEQHNKKVDGRQKMIRSALGMSSKDRPRKQAPTVPKAQRLPVHPQTSGPKIPASMTPERIKKERGL